MIILIIIVLCIFGFAFFAFAKAIYQLLKIPFYGWFANEKQVDRGYEKEILMKTGDYKEFSNNLDRKF